MDDINNRKKVNAQSNRQGPNNGESVSSHRGNETESVLQTPLRESIGRSIPEDSTARPSESVGLETETNGIKRMGSYGGGLVIPKSLNRLEDIKSGKITVKQAIDELYKMANDGVVDHATAKEYAKRYEEAGSTVKRYPTEKGKSNDIPQKPSVGSFRNDTAVPEHIASIVEGEVRSDFGADGEAKNIHIRPNDDTGLQRIASLFGKKLYTVQVEGETSPSFGGMVVHSSPKDIFLDANAKDHHLVILRAVSIRQQAF